VELRIKGEWNYGKIRVNRESGITEIIKKESGITEIYDILHCIKGLK
jgi:hypothetical protein